MELFAASECKPQQKGTKEKLKKKKDKARKISSPMIGILVTLGSARAHVASTPRIQENPTTRRTRGWICKDATVLVLATRPIKMEHCILIGSLGLVISDL